MSLFRRAPRLAVLAVAATLVTATAACSATSATVIVTKTLTSSPFDAGGGTAGASTTAASSASASSSAPSTESLSASDVTESSGATSSTLATSTDPTTTTSSKPAKPVHVSTFEGDGKTYGVGMAVMVLMSAEPTDSTAFTKAVTVTVNGKPADGYWFWQQPTVPGYQMEALFREKGYWPANSTIDVDLPLKGLSAGAGLVYDDSLTVTFKIGDAHISYVDSAQHQMTVTDNGEVVKNFPVSLGASITPTFDGTKVVMAKGEVKPGTHTLRPNGEVRMVSSPDSPDTYDEIVPWSVRITNSGEFVHAADWNLQNIGNHNTSNGCTNLNPTDAQWFYHFSQIGDVVVYKDANPKGTVQPSWDGWGWWNLTWPQWSRGGELLNH
jgi:lipoprotein-anchoring transpeptidase ErfK/SrfK